MRLTKLAFLAVLGVALAGVNPLPAAAQNPPAPQGGHFLVVLDPAHGGDDAGGKLNNTLEKSWTLAYAQRLHSLLSARGIAVSVTRGSDATLSANERAALANHSQPQACLILHATTSGSGVHIFVSSLSPQQSSAKLMAWRTMQAAQVPRSIALAGELNSALSHAGLPVSMTRTSLAVMDSMACPAVALELAPLPAAGKQNAAQLDDKDYLARSADAIAAALVAWRAEAR